MSEQAVSQAERHFIISNAIKRSRRYFDIPKLNHLEHQLELQRRMPLAIKETIESRVGESFISSDQRLHTKVSHDLDFFHNKKGRDEQDQTETAYTARTNKAKTVDMRRMLARSDLQRTRLIYRNEEQFNNYFETKHRPKMSLDFEKSIGRRQSSDRYTEDPEQHSGERVNKTYQKVLFDQGNFSCFVDYKKNGKHIPKPITDQSPTYDPVKLSRADSLTRRNPSPQQLQFHQGNGRTDPGQLDNRIIKENEYFWRGVREQRERLKDFAAGKRQEDQQRRKVEAVMGRHRPIDAREEMCDEKYFRRQHHH